MRTPLHYLRTIRSHRKPVAFVASRVLRAARVSHFITMKFDRFRLRLYPTSISEAYWFDRHDRSDDHEFLERYLRPGDTVIDVGANIGALALHSAALVGDTGQVIAFEPHPRTYRYLCGNVSLNRARNIRAHRVALGSNAGEIAFSDVRNNDDVNGVDPAGTLRVPIAPLDSFTAGLARIDLVKIDVEGYEREVLRGAGQTLARTAAVFFESWDRQFAKYEYGTPEVVAILARAGFETFAVRQGDIRPVPSDYHSQKCENLVAIRDPAEFRSRWNRRA